MARRNKRQARRRQQKIRNSPVQMDRMLVHLAAHPPDGLTIDGLLVVYRDTPITLVAGGEPRFAAFSDAATGEGTTPIAALNACCAGLSRGEDTEAEPVDLEIVAARGDDLGRTEMPPTDENAYAKKRFADAIADLGADPRAALFGLIIDYDGVEITVSAWNPDDPDHDGETYPWSANATLRRADGRSIVARGHTLREVCAACAEAAWAADDKPDVAP